MFIKRYIVIILVSVLTANLWSAETPVSKGASIVGGQAAFSMYRGELYGNPRSYYSIGLEVNYQRFFFDGVALGFDFVYDLESQNDLTQYTIAIGPMFSSFFGTGEENYFPYFQGSVVLGKIQGLTDEQFPGEYSKNLIRPSFSAGLVYLLSEHFALNGGLKYSLNITKADGVETLKESRLGVQLGLNLFLY